MVPTATLRLGVFALGMASLGSPAAAQVPAGVDSGLLKVTHSREGPAKCAFPMMLHCASATACFDPHLAQVAQCTNTPLVLTFMTVTDYCYCKHPTQGVKVGHTQWEGTATYPSLFPARAVCAPDMSPPSLEFEGLQTLQVHIATSDADEADTLTKTVVPFRCQDQCDGDLTKQVQVSWHEADANCNGAPTSYDAHSTGSYSLRYQCQDSSGNTASLCRTIINEALASPIIDVTGSDIVQEKTAHMDYIDPGATCHNANNTIIATTHTHEAWEGSTREWQTVGDIDLDTTGLYRIVYSCEDQTTGISATPATRSVSVYDAASVAGMGITQPAGMEPGHVEGEQACSAGDDFVNAAPPLVHGFEFQTDTVSTAYDKYCFASCIVLQFCPFHKCQCTDISGVNVVVGSVPPPTPVPVLGTSAPTPYTPPTPAPRECNTTQFLWVSSTSGANYCLDCPGGKFSDGDQHTCQSRTPSPTPQLCRENMYKWVSLATYHVYCLGCPEGKFSPGGQVEECEGSTTATTPVATEAPTTPVATSCDAGKYRFMVDGTLLCVDCPAGTYSDIVDTQSCHTCPRGKHSASYGHTVCDSCEAGKFGVHAGAFNVCVDCPRGKYGDQVGDSACATCPAGLLALQSGSSNCTACPTGQHTGSSWEGCQANTTAVVCPAHSSCAAAPAKCKYYASEELTEEGCSAHPCGDLKCESVCSHVHCQYMFQKDTFAVRVWHHSLEEHGVTGCPASALAPGPGQGALASCSQSVSHRCSHDKISNQCVCKCL
jgi:hypothetical protein